MRSFIIWVCVFRIEICKPEGVSSGGVHNAARQGLIRKNSWVIFMRRRKILFVMRTLDKTDGSYCVHRAQPGTLVFVDMKV